MFLTFILASLFTMAPDAVVRPLDEVIAQSLHDSCLVSPTLRALVDELDRSDLIIHIIPMSADHRTSFAGTLNFVVSAGGRRFLRITINERLSPERIAATIGHELQHAVEVARAPSVVDVKSFNALYRRIGDEASGKPNVECYETDAARRAGERVMAELRDARS